MITKQDCNVSTAEKILNLTLTGIVNETTQELDILYEYDANATNPAELANLAYDVLSGTLLGFSFYVLGVQLGAETPSIGLLLGLTLGAFFSMKYLEFAEETTLDPESWVGKFSSTEMASIIVSIISLVFSGLGLTSDFFADLVALPQVGLGLILLIGGAGSLRLLTDEGFGKKLLFMSFQVISYALGLIFCIISAYRIISEIIPQEEETA